MDDEIGGLVGAVTHYLRLTVDDQDDGYGWERRLAARDRLVKALAEIKRSQKIREGWS